MTILYFILLKIKRLKYVIIFLLSWFIGYNFLSVIIKTNDPGYKATSIFFGLIMAICAVLLYRVFLVFWPDISNSIREDWTEATYMALEFNRRKEYKQKQTLAKQQKQFKFIGTDNSLNKSDI